MFNNSTLNEVKAKNTDITVENTVDQRIKPGLYTCDSRAAALRATGARSEDARRGSTLSTAHNRPRLIYTAGGSIFTTTKGQEMPAVGGGKRGRVQGFSRQSRRRLMLTIGTIRRDAELPLFVTLTYPNEFPTVERAKRDLKVFIQRLERQYPGAGYIWKLEPQERGAPHYHMLVWGCNEIEMYRWVAQNWYEIAGQGDYKHYLFHAGALGNRPCVERVKSFRGVWSYASKYLGKTFEVAQWGKEWVGRFWGVGKRQNIPFGAERQMDLTTRQIIVLMRYQRRYSRIKTRQYNSMTIFCNADQWVEKLVGNKDQQRKC